MCWATSDAHIPYWSASDPSFCLTHPGRQHLGRQWMTDQALGFLPPSGRSGWEFLALGFSLIAVGIWGVNQWLEDSLSSSQIIFQNVEVFKNKTLVLWNFIHSLMNNGALGFYPIWSEHSIIQGMDNMWPQCIFSKNVREERKTKHKNTRGQHRPDDLINTEVRRAFKPDRLMTWTTVKQTVIRLKEDKLQTLVTHSLHQCRKLS